MDYVGGHWASVGVESPLRQPTIGIVQLASSEPPQAEQTIDPQGGIDAAAERNAARDDGYEPTAEPPPDEDHSLYAELLIAMVANIQTGVLEGEKRTS